MSIQVFFNERNTISMLRWVRSKNYAVPNFSVMWILKLMSRVWSAFTIYYWLWQIRRIVFVTRLSMEEEMKEVLQRVAADVDCKFLVHCLRSTSNMDKIPLQKVTNMCPRHLPVIIFAYAENKLKARCCVPQVIQSYTVSSNSHTTNLLFKSRKVECMKWIFFIILLHGQHQLFSFLLSGAALISIWGVSRK